MADSCETERVHPCDSATNAEGHDDRDLEILAVIAGIQRDVALYGLSRRDLFSEHSCAAVASTRPRGRPACKAASRRWRQRA